MQDYKKLYGDQVLVQTLDVTKKSMVEQSFQEAIDHFGYIDICVNNAGYMQCGAIEEMSEEEVRRIFDCNFFGTLFVTQQAACHMRERKSGVIVQTASLSAVDTIAGEGIYGATKHAILGMSSALYHELLPFNVHTIVIEPGPIKTNMSKLAKLCKRRIPDYKEVLEPELTRWGEGDHTVDSGDPDKCAQALLKIVDSENPPKQIVFTSFAYDVLQQSTHERLAEAAEWKELSFSADIEL